jgi:N-acetylglucosaminyldiphosphoundecaprenol N-acetyl-beta-D-mannosaminyltransferase
MRKLKFYNLRLDVLNYREALNLCTDYLEGKEFRTVFFINAHCFNVAQKNHSYAKILNQCDLLLNDGIGINIAARCTGIKLKANMNGSDFTPQLLKLAAEKGKRIFLLGSKPGVAEKCRMELEKSNPSIKICGTHHGYFKAEENENIIHRIRESGADVLLAGMGVPAQEFWIMNNKEALPQIKMAIAAGAVMDFISGNIRRAPSWIRKIKMEWLYRFLMEPKRLFKRYCIGNILFFYHIARYIIQGKN